MEVNSVSHADTRDHHIEVREKRGYTHARYPWHDRHRVSNIVETARVECSVNTVASPVQPSASFAAFRLA